MNTHTYMHIRETDLCQPFDVYGGAATLAMDITEYPDFYAVEVGVAFCSYKDKFVKKTGREVADERLKNDKNVFSLRVFKGERIKEKVFDVFTSYILWGDADSGFAKEAGLTHSNVELPQWIRRFMGLW